MSSLEYRVFANGWGVCDCDGCKRSVKIAPWLASDVSILEIINNVSDWIGCAKTSDVSCKNNRAHVGPVNLNWSTPEVYLWWQKTCERRKHFQYRKMNKKNSNHVITI